MVRMAVTKIISGGQTGADEAGLKAGKHLGLETGGWMPRGFLTQTGPRPDMAELYGMKEHASDRYPPRTKANIADGDGTVVFGNPKSRGCTLTVDTCDSTDKPCFLVPLHGDYKADEFLEWLKTEDIKVLNVAGNREESRPGIGQFVFNFLTKALA